MSRLPERGAVMHALSAVAVVSVSCLLLVASVRAADSVKPNSRATSSAQIRTLFADPPREYSSAPLWVWNDMLTEEQIVTTLRDLAGQNVKQAIVHPRPGLMTPYLSKQWFDLWKAALREAERLDMNLWIYDENSYPSGFAGGFVPDAMPESRGQSIGLAESKTSPKWSDNTVAVFQVSGGKAEDVTARVRAAEKLDGTQFLVFNTHLAGTTPWLAGKFYVDVLLPGVTEKFLDITMEAYKREIGEHFGKRVPGVFTDEPHLRPAPGLHWTKNLPELFEKRWGYKLVENLPSLFRSVGDWKRVRHDYYRLLLEQFIERWGKPYYEWCERNGLEFTGHYWDHEWPSCLLVPDSMALYAWHQRPAIDVLMNRYDEIVNGQFGTLRMVKELGSVANQLGKPRTLCEAYGAGGWDMRFEDMKRIGDWIYVLGVNTLDQHLSFITIRGARKHDHPQSFSYHEPWWQDYGVVGRYFERLSAAISQGEEVNNILVLEPTATAWLYNSGAEARPELAPLGESFGSLLQTLSKAQIEYDLGCEDIIERHGSVAGKELVIGQRSYSAVVLPKRTENLYGKTAELLAKYVKAGGAVYACGEPPALVDGRSSDRLASLAREPSWHATDPQRLVGELQALADDFAIEPADGDKGILLHQRRKLADGDLLLLVNTSLEASSSGTVTSLSAGRIERWDLNTGETAEYPFKRFGKGAEAEFKLAPGGSLLLFLGTAAAPAPASAKGAETAEKQIRPAGELAVQRLEPNVLTIDYVDITAGGETKKDCPVLVACAFVFQKHGLKGNPWDRAVQFKDELITKTFPPESGFEAAYRFTIKERVPELLHIVIERPDLYTITCNGKLVTPERGAWWLDKSFGKIDITAAARAGDNVVTIKASPLTVYHELAAAYLLGDFALKPADKGFAIVPPQPLKLGKWNEQGAPLYSGGVAYKARFDLSSSLRACKLALPSWLGSVARVRVNGKPAGHIWHQPWELDVTKLIRPGSNEIEVVVIATLKNTLGPHYNNPQLGAAWPGGWNNAPNPGPPAGKNYSTVGYGLFEPFTLYVTE